MRSKGDGLYSCSYTPTSPLKHTVAVTWGGVSIANSPFRVSSQSQHPVTTGGDIPPRSEDPVKAQSAAVVNSKPLVEFVQSQSTVSEKSVEMVQSKCSGASSKTKKPLIIITTYVEERYSF